MAKELCVSHDTGRKARLQRDVGVGAGLNCYNGANGI